jgi:hypothetical protein
MAEEDVVTKHITKTVVSAASVLVIAFIEKALCVGVNWKRAAYRAR